MNKLFTKAFVALMLISMLSGCATIVNGSKQEVAFSSQPVGATITIDGQMVGVTPRKVMLKRSGRLPGEREGKKSYNVLIEMDGYQPYNVTIARSLDGWILGNLVDVFISHWCFIQSGADYFYTHILKVLLYIY
jgi:hypothetical protein